MGNGQNLTAGPIRMKLKILPSAVCDLYAGRFFYENQGQGLGEYFFDSLFSDIDSLLLYAGIHQKVWGYYRMLSKRFPYAVYYKIDGDHLVVWRVMDLRQRPSKIKRSLLF
jgi:hypothetical protein